MFVRLASVRCGLTERPETPVEMQYVEASCACVLGPVGYNRIGKMLPDGNINYIWRLFALIVPYR